MKTTEQVYKGAELFLSNHDYIFRNSYIFGWESDIFALTKSGLSVEIEVKVSRSDFFADFKKEDKHRYLSSKGFVIKSKKEYISQWGYENNKYTYLDGEACRVEFINSILNTPNRFYYACPDGLILPNEIPKYAGLIYGNKVVKKAPLLHNNRNVTKEDLLPKLYWRRINALTACNNISGLTIEEFKNKIENILK